MRDEHRPKQELIHEVTGLRKQVADLKEAMTVRRRVEDALRDSEELLRSLVDGAPIGLALFSSDGALLAANRPFATVLGYDSTAELQRLGGVLGVFDDSREQARVLEAAGPIAPVIGLFRHKDGTRSPLEILTLRCPSQHTTVVAILPVQTRSHLATIPSRSA
jgi:PAS domain S-box-containing protein